MLHFLPSSMLGCITVLLLVINTLFWAVSLYFFTILKLLIPWSPIRTGLSHILNAIAQTWIRCNNAGLLLTRRITWQVSGIDELKKDRWYLVISNHQSWTDIVVLQKVFSGKIPFLKFFLKKELIWVPVLGIAWWALDFPFMKRYSPSFLEKNPHLRGKDIEITKRACVKFRDIPVSVMNFVEGTRFTAEKHDRQQSPFANLLKPKSGGIGFVFSTMGEYLSSILNVTIAYPGGPYSFWDFLCGRVTEIRVDVEEIPVSAEHVGDYVEDPLHRERFQGWLNGLWVDKDRRMDEMLGRAVPEGGCPVTPDPEMAVSAERIVN